MKLIPTYCYQCYNGPDPILVKVVDDVAVGIEPNYNLASIHHSGGRICSNPYGLIDKLYNPYRVKSPLLRQNPSKGRDEDPQWKEISWDEALKLLVDRLRKVKDKGGIDENGYPRIALTLGGAGTPEGHFGLMPTFLSTMFRWVGPIDLTIGTGQGVKCYHSEHVYGEFWHRAFMVVADLPLTRYILSFGHNDNASSGVGAWRQAQAREHGLRMVKVEPHLSVSGANADSVIFIKPKTDAMFLFSMVYVILHEKNWREVCDIEFLKKMTNSPYLIGPNGYYLRDKETGKPLVWDTVDRKAKTFDDPLIKDFALVGQYNVSGMERGPDGKAWQHENIKAKPSFQVLIEAVSEYTPEKAESICEIPAGTIREVTEEFLTYANVGAIIDIDGEKLPYRPVAIELGKTVNNGPGGYETCWARTVLLMLVGALEVPGGVIGPGSRLNPPYHMRWMSVEPGEDGFMLQHLNPTEKDKWPPKIMFRGPFTALTPLIGYRGWASGIAPFTLAWIFMDNPPQNWPKPSPPDVWMIYRANPLRTQWDPELLERVVKKFPFIVHFTYVLDETSWYADLILPDHTDLEGLQLTPIFSKHWYSLWEYYGYILKQPVVKPLYNTMDMTDIIVELMDRLGLLRDFNSRVNRGSGTDIPLSGENYNFTLEEDRKHSSEEIWDRICKAATAMLSGGKEVYGLSWFRENSVYLRKYSRLERYLYYVMKKKGLRFEIPYQERIKRMGEELGNRLHERGIHWWDKQLEEYKALPRARDFSEEWSDFYRRMGEDPEKYDFWLISARSPQLVWTANVSNPRMLDAASRAMDFGGVVINSKRANEKGIKHGDVAIIESPFGKKEAKAIVREGQRPDVALLVGQLGECKTPYAKDLPVPNVSDFIKLDLDLLDSGGSGCDLVKVKIYKAHA
ncbi:MAG: molybdopterin-dependent oxidoreductase [Candidatus Brockarchaeota archaeon]|nr:molybdopterin-dependent oxidoreductase [Candidatus Brockarchaeota archaeon]